MITELKTTTQLPVWARGSANLDECDNGMDVIKKCGLDWNTELLPISTYGSREIDDIPVIGQDIPQVRASRRSDTKEILGIVGEGYTPVHNKQLLPVFDELVEASNSKYFSGGCLTDGKWPSGSRVYLVAKSKEPLDIGGDQCWKIQMMIGGHNGSVGISFKNMIYREICSNGLIATEEGLNDTVLLKHTANVQERMLQTRKILKTQEIYFARMQKTMNEMTKQTMSENDMQAFVVTLLPVHPVLSENTPRSLSAIREKRTKIKGLMHWGRGLESHRNTRWAAYNAVTEYVDHHQNQRKTVSGSDTGWIDRTMFTSGAKLKSKAYKLLAV